MRCVNALRRATRLSHSTSTPSALSSSRRVSSRGSSSSSGPLLDADDNENSDDSEDDADDVVVVDDIAAVPLYLQPHAAPPKLCGRVRAKVRATTAPAEQHKRSEPDKMDFKNEIELAFTKPDPRYRLNRNAATMLHDRGGGSVWLARM